MKISQGAGRLPPCSRGLAEDLVQYVCQLCRLAVLHGINKDPPSRPLRYHVDALQPPLDIGPSRLAMADNQKLIDSRDRKKLRGKSLRLGCRRGIGLHDLGHLSCQIFGTGYLGLVDLHAHPRKDIDIDQILDLHEALDVGWKIHDDEKIPPRIIQDLASRCDERRKKFFHLPDREKAHWHHLKGIAVLFPLCHRAGQSFALFDRNNPVKVACLDCHSVVHAQHLMKDGKEIFFLKRLGTVNRYRAFHLGINGVGEL